MSFVNEDNKLYNKNWGYNFDFFHPDLLSLAVFWNFEKPNGGGIAQGVFTIGKIITNKTLINCLLNSVSLFEFNPVKIDFKIKESSIYHNFDKNR